MTDDVSLADRSIPDDLAARIQVAFDLDEPPATLADWMDETVDLREAVDVSVDREAMCTTEKSRHQARIDGEREYFRCVLDALLLPVVVEGNPTVEVRSRSPVSGETVTVTLDRDSIDIEPEEAVMSLGLHGGFDIPEDEQVDPLVAYEMLCPYVDAFASTAEYEEWAADRPEAITMPMSFGEGHSLLGTIARSHVFVSAMEEL